MNPLRTGAQTTSVDLQAHPTGILRALLDTGPGGQQELLCEPMAQIHVSS